MLASPHVSVDRPLNVGTAFGVEHDPVTTCDHAGDVPTANKTTPIATMRRWRITTLPGLDCRRPLSWSLDYSVVELCYMKSYRPAAFRPPFFPRSCGLPVRRDDRRPSC